MTDPAPPPEPERTCPNCRRQVPSGAKFCEACGTPVPSLYTCSRCGTQFTHPMKYCDLCGARLVPAEAPAPEKVVVRKREEAPEPEKVVIRKKEEAEPETVVVRRKAGAPEPEEAEAPEPAPEEYPEEGAEPQPDETVPDEEAVPEPDEGEGPGLAPEETTEEELAAIFRPKKQPRPARQEIREPDTAELLAKYGSDEDKEAGSAARPATGWRSWFRRREPPPKNADEALFLAEGKPEGQVRPRQNRMLQVLGAGMMAAAVIAASVLFGLPLLAGIVHPTGSPGAQETPVPSPTVTGTAAATTIPTTVAGALVPRPTQTIPDHMPDFRIYKNLVTYQITVIFVGSSGEGGVTRADVTVTRPDGTISSQSILPLKGIAEVNLNGSKAPDRVQIDAVSGDKTYHVYDSLLSPGDGI